jgi:hypothetical protein
MADTQATGASTTEETKGEDKTLNEKDVFEGLPNEDDISDDEEEDDDDSPTSKKERDSDDDDEDDKKSHIRQKRKYREKLLKAQEKIRELESGRADKVAAKQPINQDDKELAAQKYIRDQARAEYEAILAEEKAKEEEAVEKFEAALEDVLEENPDYTEKQVLDIVEDYEVSPEVAIKILKKTSETSAKKKPKMPSSKRASESVASPKATSTETFQNKSMYQLAQDAIKEYKANRKAK